jgi:nuclear transport factor 2 (NTF2) superfamily protein
VVPIIRTETIPRHRAFFEALAQGTEHTDAWRTEHAGLVTLRFLDSWREGGGSWSGSWSDAAFHYERDAIESAIANVPEALAERRLLATIVERIVLARAGQTVSFVPPLFAYARALDLRSAWAVAAAVYGVLWESFVARDRIGPVDEEVAQSVAQHLGNCHRMLGDHARASEGYAAAAALAGQRGDERATLHARLGQAKVFISQGYLHEAELRLVAIVGAATGLHLTEVRARAWHDLAGVAYRCGQMLAGIEYAYEAWQATEDAVERERVLITLASLLLNAGYPDVSRDANVLLAATAVEPVVRWGATINLIEIATIERREIDFARYRKTLGQVDLPPFLAGEFHFYVGRGHLAFDQPGLAAEAFGRAVMVAERHGLSELLMRARGQGPVQAPKVVAPTPRPSAVRRVADALHNARLLAAVGA